MFYTFQATLHTTVNASSFTQGDTNAHERKEEYAETNSGSEATKLNSSESFFSNVVEGVNQSHIVFDFSRFAYKTCYFSYSGKGM